jgi:hypothetical protein
VIHPLKFVKAWFRNNFVEEVHWDEIVNKVGAWAAWTNNNLKQLGLDIGGETYDFNNVGKKTQSIPVFTRLTTLEGVNAGVLNIGIDITDSTRVTLVGSTGSVLSSSNSGKVVINETSDAGSLLTYTLTSSQSVLLTGAHWGFDGEGDLTDYPLWLIFIDTGSTVVLGVTAEGGKESVTSSDCKTAPGDVTSRSHVLVSSAVSGTSNVLYFGWVKANFDDSGGASENLWTLQSGAGDVNLGATSTYLEVGALRF